MTTVRKSLSWVIRRFGVATLTSWLLLLVVMSTLSFLLTRNIGGLDSDLLFGMAAIAMLVAWWLGGIRLRPSRAIALGVLLGLLVILVRVGNLAAKLIDLSRALAELYWAAARGYATTIPDLQPVAGMLTALASDIGTLFARAQAWALAMASGQPVFDPVAAALMWAIGMWLVSAWAAYALRRWHNVLLALAPVVAVMATTLIYIGEDPKTLLMPLGVALCLLVIVGQSAREERWRSSGIDFWEGMRLDLVITAVPITIGLLLTASIVPSISIQRIAEWASKTFIEPAAEARPVVPESLGLKPKPRPARPPDNLLAPGLPRRHLIGASPDLSRDIVMYVTTNELPPPYEGMPVYDIGREEVLRYYWRGSTYDRYTGAGWVTRDTQNTEYRAGEAALTESMTSTMTSTHRLVRESVTLVKDVGGLVYAPGVLLSTDQPYQVARRLPEDVFNVKIASDIAEYQADVLIPNAPESRLRAAPANYPKWVTDRYLELPKDVPQRVSALARDLTATAPTPYDRARAIETYLRTYSYTLDLPAPPQFRDVVDYFLFDLKQGYCDYFATSMVVLARAAGLPARLVVGYATGSFNPRSGLYAVTEMDGHSWPEIYFSGIGWVEFEPTSSRARIDRPGEIIPLDTSSIRAPSEPLTARQTRADLQRLLVVLGLAAVIGLAVVAWLLLDTWRLSRLPTEVAIARLYGRIQRQSQRVNVPVDPGDTPYEFGAAVTGWLHESVSTPAQDKANLGTEAELNRLVDLYVGASYSPHPQAPSAREQALTAWRAVRQALWRAWLRYRLKTQSRA